MVRTQTMDGVPTAGVIRLSRARLVDFERSVLDAAAAGRGVTVDVRDVSSIDSTLLAELVRADKTIRRAGGHMTITAVSPGVGETFRATGLDRRLEIRP
jgi:anti-anti-sigma factor